MSPVTELHELETKSPEALEQAPQLADAGKLGTPPFAPLPLFASVLLEADGTERRRRKWAAVTSITLQVLVVATALIVPLMFTEALPKQQLLTFLVAPPPPPPPPPPAPAAAVKVIKEIESDLLNGRLRAPSKIPQRVEMIKEEEAPPISPGGGVVGGVPGGIPGGQLGGVIGGIISSASNLAAVPKLVVPPPKRMRISQGVTSGLRVFSPDPVYPKIAQSARIQGVVILNAIISKNGDIENLQLVSGHPMLVPAALDAVKRWRYRPYLLNGEPIEVETTITVTFRLQI